MKLFQYSVVLHPTTKEQEEGLPSRLLVPITSILAHDQNTAVIQASRGIPDEHLDKLDRIEVAVRPF